MADMASLARRVETRGGFIAQRLTLDLRTGLKTAAAPHRKTGKMDNAIQVTSSRVAPTRWMITAKVPVLQATTTNFGARRHPITAHGKALKFTMGGNVMFRRTVDHPGNKAYRWFSNVMTPTNIHAMLARFVGR